MSDIVRVAGINMELLSSTETFPNEGRVACQGVKGAYSQQAANRMFAKSMPMFFKTFSGVIEDAKSGMVDYGILPIENNSYGSVRATYQLLKNAGVYIIRAERILIRHQLLVKPGTNLADVTSIRSHEQALGQCSHFLKKMEDQAAVIPVLNTAMAARYVSESEDKGAAAIASPEAAEIYVLQALSTRVSDSDNNYTRFVCISKEPKIYPGSNRISMILSVPHEPGSLYNVIGKFAKRGINITKLESSPATAKNQTNQRIPELRSRTNRKTPTLRSRTNRKTPALRSRMNLTCMPHLPKNTEKQAMRAYPGPRNWKLLEG